MIDYLKSLKKWKKIVLLILLTLLATNPSTKEFKEHLGGSVLEKKQFNGFIFSVFKADVYHRGQDYSKNELYIGLLGNFIFIGHAPS